MYPAASDWNSAAPLSGWYLRAGAQPQTCGSTGWDLLAALQTELSARVGDAGSLPSFDVTVNSVPINDSGNPSGAVGWSSDVLRVLYAVAQNLGAPSGFLSAIQSDAQVGAGPISPATLQTGIWIADRLNHRFTSSGDEVWNAGSPADVSIPAGTSYPLMDVAPPVAPSGTYGSRCNAISTDAANLIPVVRTVSPFTFSEVLIFGILLVAVGAVVVMSRDIPVTGKGGVRKNPRETSQHHMLFVHHKGFAVRKFFPIARRREALAYAQAEADKRNEVVSVSEVMATRDGFSYGFLFDKPSIKVRPSGSRTPQVRRKPLARKANKPKRRVRTRRNRRSR